MKNTIIILLSLLIYSCSNKNQYQGDIYIKLINVHSLYGMDNQKLEEIKLNITNQRLKNHSESERKMNDYFKILVKNDLFDKPHFKLKTNEGKIINVYTSETEFSKLTKELNGFDREKQKISVVFKGFQVPNDVEDSDNILNQPIYSAESIISISKLKGTTDWSK